jgi:hypothetical protein
MLAIRAVDSEIARRQRELRHAELTDESAEEKVAAQNSRS